jgi:hypothetical protein
MVRRLEFRRRIRDGGLERQSALVALFEEQTGGAVVEIAARLQIRRAGGMPLRRGGDRSWNVPVPNTPGVCRVQGCTRITHRVPVYTVDDHGQ